MRSIANLGASPAGLPIVAEDLVEFHAARLLLLFNICGIKNQIDGLTKMAKLDFFVRYPEFFEEVSAHLGLNSPTTMSTRESGMVRFHYGPWDKRYYQALGYLEGRDLLLVSKDRNAFRFALTPKGEELAKQLRKASPYAELVMQMKAVKRALGNRSGSALKALIYKVFEKEIANKPLGEAIS